MRLSEREALAEFLTAKVRADEKLADAATPGPWRYNPNKEWHLDPQRLALARRGIPMFGGKEFVAAGPDDDKSETTVGVAATGPSNHRQSMVDAYYISEWDPLRIKAECAMKLRLIADHGEPHACDNTEGADVPCSVLTTLAEVYLGHSKGDVL